MAKASKKGASAPTKTSRKAATTANVTAEAATEATTTPEAPAEEVVAQEPAKAAKPKRAPAVVQHGVQRPRAGGLCAAVWEITESHLSHNEATGEADWPTIAEVKAVAAAKGLNPTNVSIEYYRCRQFHGVRGRVKKVAAEATE